LKLEKDEHIRFQRLSYAHPSKNVTFLVSGYLSEDSDKDLEWQGIIRSLEECEMYGVLWKSSTKTELLKYVATIAGGIALSNVSSTAPILAGVASLAFSIAK
jgi:hypothetical protein